MKKLFTISLAFVYLAISSGLVLQIHYCMGKIAGSDLFVSHSHEDACGKCGMDKEKHKCCKDEVKIVKLQDAHKQVSLDYQLNVPVAIVPSTSVWEYEASPLAIEKYYSYQTNAPPPDLGVSQRILHCVFRV